jgi:hypothetical protein
MKNKKILFVSLGLIGLGLYLLYIQSKQKPESVKKENNNTVDLPIKADWNKVLKKGSTGIEVEVLQKALKQLVVDGNFGTKTEERLKKVMGVTETSVNKYNEFINNKK